MIERSSTDALHRRLHLANTIIITGAVVVAAAIYERKRVRWWRMVHPLAAPRGHVDRLMLDLQDKRGDLAMAAAAAVSVFEIVRLVRDLPNEPG